METETSEGNFLVESLEVWGFEIGNRDSKKLSE